jgi:hypothetical protein
VNVAKRNHTCVTPGQKELQMTISRSMRLILALAAVSVASADAQSLKIRQRMQAPEEELVADVESTNKACGTTIPVNDWAGPPEDSLEAFSSEGYCDAALSSIRRICGDDMGKKAVIAKIKSMTCAPGPARSIAFKDGALDYQINFDFSNDSDPVYEFLQNSLRPARAGAERSSSFHFCLRPRCVRAGPADSRPRVIAVDENC